MDTILRGIYRNRALQLADAMELCHDGIENYASAVALLAVHSAITFGDVVLITLTGRRSRVQDHRRAITSITAACKKAEVHPDGIRHLSALVGAKTDVSYGDEEVDRQRAEVLYVAARRFQTWAEGVLRTKEGIYANK